MQWYRSSAGARQKSMSVPQYQPFWRVLHGLGHCGASTRTSARPSGAASGGGGSLSGGTNVSSSEPSNDVWASGRKVPSSSASTGSSFETKSTRNVQPAIMAEPTPNHAAAKSE